MSKERVIKMKRAVRAGRERVFAALTDAGRLREWFCDQVWIDPRVGGRYAFRWNTGYEVQGAMIEFDRPEEIVMVWQGLNEPAQTLVEWELAETEAGTEVELKHVGFGRGTYWDATFAEAERGWAQALENLQSVLEEGVDLRTLRRPFLGVFLDQLTTERVQEEGIATETGVYITNPVEGGAAEAAGVQAGDVVVSLGGREVIDFPSLGAALQAFRAGDTVEVELVRGQERLTVSATLKQRELPEVPSDPAEIAAQLRERQARWKAALEEATAGLSEEEAGRPPAEEEWSVKQVLAHLIPTERFVQRYIIQTMAGQWVEGAYDNAAAPDQMAVTLAAIPTLEGLLKEFIRNMEETVLLFEHLPEAAQFERNRCRNAATVAFQLGDHTEEHLAQIAETVKAVRAPVEGGDQ